MRIEKIHINGKDWKMFCEKMKMNGIRTIAELEMYCRVWEISSAVDLFYRLTLDCNQIIYEKGVR